MAKNVLPLRGNEVCTSPGEPNEQIVAYLEERLEQARAGRIRAMACAFVIEDGSHRPLTDQNYTWEYGRFRDLYYAFGQLAARINKECGDR